MSAPAPPPADAPHRRPVGVLDSGIGGLTVLHELLVRLPREDYLYLADAAPGGIEAGAEELFARRVKLLVVASNSASATALPALRKQARGVEVLGAVQPAAVAAAAATRNGRVGYLASAATAGSGAYERAVAAADPFVSVTGVACRGLAALIERGAPFDEETVDAVRRHAIPLREADVDTVILGSSYYAPIRPLLQRTLGGGVEIVGSAEPLARQVERVLAGRGLANEPGREGEHRFLTPGDVDALRAAGTRFLQLPLGPIERVEMGVRS